MNIRLFKPSVGQEELNSIKDVFERSWLGLGPKVGEFEQEWSKFIGCQAALGVNSATAALHLALQAFQFPKGKKVLVPAITFSATGFAPIYNGLEPVFVDVDEETASMSIEDMERKYDKDVVAIIPVHFAGHPARIDEIVAFAKSKNVKVIEDCAHTAGGEFKGKKLGTWGDFGCFSFEEKKCMTTGDGGMLVSDNKELIDYIKPARWVGIDKDTWRRSSDYVASGSDDAKHWYYDIGILGYKYNMNDLAAAIGLVQLKKLPEMNRRRSEIIRNYLTKIDNPRILPLLPYQPEKYVYHLFGVRTSERDKLVIHLKKQGIATGVHYVPLPEFSYFSTFRDSCPVASRIWQQFVTVPLHADLEEAEVAYIVSNINSFK